MAMHFVLAFIHPHLIVAHLPEHLQLQAMSSCVGAIADLGNLQYIRKQLILWIYVVVDCHGGIYQPKILVH